MIDLKLFSFTIFNYLIQLVILHLNINLIFLLVAKVNVCTDRCDII